MQILGEDVIGLPGQRLTPEELGHLVRLADGGTPSQIQRATGADPRQQQRLELAIRAKLGARTKPHMIARAFVLEVLAPRALCLLLAMLSLGLTPDGTTQRPPRNSRPPATSARAGRSHRVTGNGRRPDGYPLALEVT